MKQTRVQLYRRYRQHILKMREDHVPSSWQRYLQKMHTWFNAHETMIKVVLWSTLTLMGVIVLALFFMGERA